MSFRTQPVFKELQQLEPSCCEKLTSTEDIDKQTKNSKPKSTVVMEVSTMQKVIQVIDREQNSVPSDYVSYKVTPEPERRIEFIVQNKSDQV